MGVATHRSAKGRCPCVGHLEGIGSSWRFDGTRKGNPCSSQVGTCTECDRIVIRLCAARLDGTAVNRSRPCPIQGYTGERCRPPYRRAKRDIARSRIEDEVIPTIQRTRKCHERIGGIDGNSTRSGERHRTVEGNRATRSADWVASDRNACAARRVGL